MAELTHFDILHLLCRMLQLEMIAKVEYSQFAAPTLANGAHDLAVELTRVPHPGLATRTLQLCQTFAFHLLFQFAFPFIIFNLQGLSFETIKQEGGRHRTKCTCWKRGYFHMEY